MYNEKNIYIRGPVYRSFVGNSALLCISVRNSHWRLCWLLDWVCRRNGLEEKIGRTIMKKPNPQESRQTKRFIRTNIRKSFSWQMFEEYLERLAAAIPKTMILK